jgi:hypothetical protein
LNRREKPGQDGPAERFINLRLLPYAMSRALGPRTSQSYDSLAISGTIREGQEMKMPLFESAAVLWIIEMIAPAAALSHHQAWSHRQHSWGDRPNQGWGHHHGAGHQPHGWGHHHHHKRHS